MAVTQKGIVALLKSAIVREKIRLPEGFDLSEAYPLVKKHHMSTLIYDGAVCCGIDPKSEVMIKLFREYIQALQVSERQMAQAGRVFAAFEENGIDYMPLKGCRMKPLYPKPELRIMGDADVLIRMEQYEQIGTVMRSLGFEEKNESDHEWVWQNDGLYLELHKRMIPSDQADLYIDIQNGWGFARQENGHRYEMSPEDEFVYLFSHFAKHYRVGGIGCRHMVDLWVYLRHHPELNEEAVCEVLKEAKLQDFYRNIRHTIGVWFEEEAATDMSDFITEYIFSSGSWGTVESNAVSRALRFSKHTPDKSNGKWAYIRQTLFPSREMLYYKYRYKFLDKAPFLLPLVWVIRIFDKLLFDRRAFGRQQRSMQQLSQENIDHAQQALNYVGLDYHL